MPRPMVGGAPGSTTGLSSCPRGGGMKALIVFFNKERTDYLVVGPLKSEAECTEEIRRLRSVYADKSIEAIESVLMQPAGAIK